MGKILSGQYSYNLDDKGRCGLPVPFREQLAEYAPKTPEPNIVLARGMNHAIFAFSIPVWDEYARRVRKLDLESKEYSHFVRLLFATSVYCTVDQQGRVVNRAVQTAELEKELKKLLK